MSVNSSLNSQHSQKYFLTYLNGTGYIFNVDDYMIIRTKHRIVGSLVGACSTKGWNPNSHSLPVELTKHETQLLVEKGLATVLRKGLDLKSNYTVEAIYKFKNFIENRISQQAELLKAEKIKESEKYVDKILAGKRNKLLKSGVEEKDLNLTKEDVLKEIADNIVFDRNNALLDIPTEHPFEHDTQIIDFPIDDSLKYRVFRDLWEKEKYVTSGEAFGADFIAYPGDPLMFHASHIIIVLDNPEFMPLDLITKCRLSVIVNKICMFAYLDNDGQIAYQSVEWEGCKDNIKRKIEVIESVK